MGTRTLRKPVARRYPRRFNIGLNLYLAGECLGNVDGQGDGTMRNKNGKVLAASSEEFEDEFDSYLDEAKHDPEFRAAYEDAQERHSILDDLVARRHDRGLAQGDVAARMGVRQPTVSGFETEDSDPRLSTLQRYARAVEARLRLTLIFPEECDWISPGSASYSDASLRGSAEVAVREGELARTWREETEQQHAERWVHA
jgi:transcriptional regulator with XRE-family HTH domain